MSFAIAVSIGSFRSKTTKKVEYSYALKNMYCISKAIISVLMLMSNHIPITKTLDFKQIGYCTANPANDISSIDEIPSLNKATMSSNII